MLDYIHQLKAELGIADDWIKRSRRGFLKPEQLKLDGRKEPLIRKKGFTSTAKQSHLLNLPEYLCMYFFAFSGMSEGLGFSSYNKLQPRLRSTNFKMGKSSHRRKVFSYSSSEYDDDLENLSAFNASASNNVRKLLANITTYMIFDDHEVIDDWNLTLKNQKSLAHSDMGKHVLKSALASYFVCQHWGNVPSKGQGIIGCVSHAHVWLFPYGICSAQVSIPTLFYGS